MKVKELFSSAGTWVQFTYAKSNKGNIVMPTAKSAVCWCLTGAIKKCYTGLLIKDEIFEKVRRELKKNHDRTSIVGWNDDSKRTFVDVKNLVEKLDI